MAKRVKVKGYAGVYYRMADRIGGKGQEKVYYVVFKTAGKVIEAKVGRQYKDDMSPARAALKRADFIEGRKQTPQEKREAEKEDKANEDNRWTIDKLWNEYKEGRRSGKGLSTDKGRYEKYLQPAFGNQEPKYILALDVERLKRRLLKKKSPQTAKHVLNLFTWIVNFGTKKGLCPGVSFHVEKPTVSNEKTEDLTQAQLKKLLKAIEEDAHAQAGNMMLMALYCGLRRGEMFKLRWKDINFDKDFITLVDPKGGPNQKVPLNEPTRALLKGIERVKGSAYVFPGRGGAQRVDINKPLSEIKRKAGLPSGFRALHGLRHVFASQLASSGEVDLYVLQRLLTHKDPRMTQRYAHLRDETLKTASELAGNIVKGIAAEGDAEIINLTDIK